MGRIDLGGSRDTDMIEGWKLENQSDQNDFDLGPERRARRPDHRGVNGSSI